jgi:hypothetical protein
VAGAGGAEGVCGWMVWAREWAKWRQEVGETDRMSREDGIRMWARAWVGDWAREGPVWERERGRGALRRRHETVVVGHDCMGQGACGGPRCACRKQGTAASVAAQARAR